MRGHADLASTARRLERAAAQGPLEGQTRAHLAALQTLVGDVVQEVDAALPRLCEGGPGVAALAARHLLTVGGKRVRPLLLVLTARALGPRVDGGAEALLAQAAELVHAATLLHDDVLDDGRMRRGVPAARVLWGNAASVLGGDFLLVRALELAAAATVPRVLDELLQAIAKMIDGEALQLAHRGRSDLEAQGYFDVVDGKTASLFAWCGRAGARLAGAGEDAVAALGAYGLHLGRAFQIVDDVLDVAGDPASLGKGVLSDLREGKLTLPVLYALEVEPGLRAQLQAAGDCDEVEIATEVARAVRQSGATERAREAAIDETSRALAALGPAPEGPYREALAFIARELCERAR